MSQSLSQILVHGIFSTKGRTPWLDDEVGPRMHAYLATVLHDKGHIPLIVGGYHDHVHVLFGLAKTSSISQAMEDIKGSSSKWIKTLELGLDEFAWQRGYAAFSIGNSEIDRTVQYIANQQSHHGKTNFQDEFRLICKENNLDFNELYAWD